MIRAVLLAASLLVAVPAAAVMPDDPQAIAEEAVRAVVVEAKALVEAARYDAAIARLVAADAETPAHADILNLLGFAHRKSGAFAAARDYYDRALAIAPNHREALEYRGELFLETGEIAAARADLDRLRRICGPDCPEYRELADKFAAAGG